LVDRSHSFEIALTGMLDKVHSLVLEDFSARREVLGTYAEMLRTRPLNLCQLQRGQLHNAASQLANRVQQKLKADGQLMEHYRMRLATEPSRWLRQVQRAGLDQLSANVMMLAQSRMQLVAMKLKGLQDAVALLGPEATLARGFSITRCDGSAVLDAANLRPGDRLSTTLSKGTVHSTVGSIEPHG
ncbi:MAG TPA: exodeoxyribonuclease VII large subunit, partial [Flavobacteriales bacterium]|nr:exodeoxyribonuclease VII large subunit [Flavobacteriales bacterium]HRP82746.1 exodeoxyribonuclease VII large subunit [Flavobacteriales bacterium]